MEPRLPSIPEGSVLGLNFSGMHDSAIAIVAPDGEPLFALSLERLSRVKQDGRPPFALLERVAWERIAKVAISTYDELPALEETASKLHPVALATPRPEGLRHAAGFHEFVDRIPCEKVFVGHQLSHAASAYWGSEFDEALCLTYDGGMSNDPWFGGLYRCDRASGLTPLDRFSARHYAKVTSLYTAVTALLGFTPNKHEGKITGLAAYGAPSDRCLALLQRWFTTDYFELEACLRWVFSYDEQVPARLLPDPARMERFRAETQDIPATELAASVQDFAERHVLAILENAKREGWSGRNLCVAGGLFANVKINQRLLDAGFERLFVAPPMTDDGTALGAAWQALHGAPGFKPAALRTMFLGPAYPVEQGAELVRDGGIAVLATHDAAREIADLLAKGNVVAVFQGAAEYGPRALGNRSILAAATEADINRTLNERLNRTEFMPFAPVSRAEDAARLYLGIERVAHAAQFMTVTVDCTDEMRAGCPAVVHVDGTARPQLVTAQSNPLIHAVLTHYAARTGRYALVNTSFNIHEEPIVCSPADALRGFFESGIDYLYLEGTGLIAFRGNESAAVRYLQQKLRTPKARGDAQLVELLARERATARAAAEEKEDVIRELDAGVKGRDREIEALRAAHDRELEALRASRDRDLETLRAGRDRDLEALRATLEQQRAAAAAHAAEKDATIQSLFMAVQNSHAQYQMLEKTLAQKERAITTLNRAVESPDLHLAMVKALEEKEAVIRELNRAVEAYRSAFSIFGWLIRPLNFFFGPLRVLAAKARSLLMPRLGNLIQHAPRKLDLHLDTPPLTANPPPRISIVTPSFRQAAFIERTIRSVLDQGYPALEYVIQDGGSEDGTKEIIQRYEKQLAGWESCPDNGQADAINRGFAKSSGEIMAWLNSDDVLFPGALAYVGEYFARHPEIDVVYGHRMLIDEEDRQIGRWIMPAHDDEVLSWADYIPQETLFWRRRVWEKAGGRLDESFRFALDWDLLVRFRQAGARFARLPRTLGGFRIHASQKTSAVINEVGFREMDRIRERVLGRVPSSHEVRKAVAPYLLKHLATDFRWRIRNKLGAPS